MEKADTSRWRELVSMRRRSITRKMTPQARAEREAFLQRPVYKSEDIRTLDRYRKELNTGSYSISQMCAEFADDARFRIVFVDRGGRVIFERPQTVEERTIPLFR